MNEKAWLAAVDERPILEHMRHRAKARQLLHFIAAAACGCDAWKLEDILELEAVNWAMRFIEGEVPLEDLQQVSTRFQGRLPNTTGFMLFFSCLESDVDVLRSAFRMAQNSVAYRANQAGRIASESVARELGIDRRAFYADYYAPRRESFNPNEGYEILGRFGQAERSAAKSAARAAKAENCRILRCIFGNPFRPATLDPSWLTNDVGLLAKSIYAERQRTQNFLDNQRMAVLADALEEAGCDNADLLGHLRGSGEHVRGCWALDLLLAKD
jgi:hypothetical protein